MKNIQMLILGVKEIAKNHNAKAFTNYKEEGEVCVIQLNTSAKCDISLLCEDLGISKEDVGITEFGADIFITEEWLENVGNKPYEKKIGMEMWRRTC